MKRVKNRTIKNFLKTLVLGAGLLSLSWTVGCSAGVGNQAPSNNISLVVSPTTNELFVFDLRTHRVIDKLETGNRPDDLAVSQDGRRILVTNVNDGSISAYQRLTGTEFISIGKINVQGSVPQGVAFNSTGTRAYVAVGDTSTISTLDTSNPNRLPVTVPQGVIRLGGDNLGARPSPAQIAVSPDNTRLFALDRGNGRVLAFNLNPGQDSITPGEFFQVPPNIPVDLKDIVVDRTGRVYALNSATDELLVFNGANIQQPVSQVALRVNQPPLNANTPISPENIALNNAGTKLYITGSAANVALVLPNPQGLQGQQSLQNVGRPIPLLARGVSATSPFGIDVTSNDRLVYVANGGGGFNVSLINGETDLIERNIGTSANAANSPPLGRMKIIFFGSTPLVPGIASTDSDDAVVSDPVSSLRFFDYP